MDHRTEHESEAAAEARRLIEAVETIYRQPLPAPIPTRFRDETPSLPSNTAPVPQPDPRAIPAWAAGTAVAGIGVGAACVGLGCGVWLACQGFAAVSLMSVLFVTLPIAALAAGAAAVATAIRGARAARPQHHHHYGGDVHQDNSTHSIRTTGLIAHTRADGRRR
ncbi:hypothetical protein QWJ26_24470 [Streptomyces sp. CSDS2]|uniref:hypothetical protein n=1 Tax=Streptomyces sp. CSDS2 TaxID=3055051 RepID=UPI0025AEE204|nr:hypothetical protein [Streptomyces sp. CSDS2]MDN3262904.1 hypothetical protein [Streptomyces sp. CSDS2]